MEWRQQTSLSCTDAFNEAQRWIEEVTGKSFDCIDFRAALENGVLLSDLMNQLKPGIIKRVNRLSTPIAGLDNVSVFLKACGKLGLNESQLFHPGDLQDLSTRVTLKRDEGNRRLKNVLITIYWLGRKANQDTLYKGPQLNFKSFEGLLGLALSRSLDDGSGYYCPEKDDAQCKKPSYKRYSSVDSATSPDAKARTTNSEGCGSDAEAEQVFRMETSHVLAQSSKGYLPPPLQKVKQAQGGRGCTSPLSRPGQTVNTEEKPVQVNPGWIWSKSLSDIPMVYPVRQMSDETQESGPTHFKRKSSITKDTEALWQDDFTKWKNRRRSSKSDVRRTSVDREHVINQMTNGANFQKATSQSGPIKRDQPSQHSHSPGSHPYSTSPTKSSKSNLRPHTRALLARSNATEMPFNAPSSYDSRAHIQGPTVGAMPGPKMNVLKKDGYVASLASVGVTATTPSLEFPYSSQSHVQNSPGPTQPSSQDVTEDICTRSSVLPKEMSKLNAAAESLSLVNHTEIDAVNDLTVIRPHWEKQESSTETSKGQGFDKYLSTSGTWSGSASLPRGYRRSEGTSRLSSAITARPFGSKPSRVSSLPRLCSVEDNHQNWLSSEDKDVSPPATTLLKRQTPSAHLKGHPPLRHTELGAEQEKENCAILCNVIQTNGFHPEPLVQTLSLHQLCTAEMPQLHSNSTLVKEPSDPMHEDHSDMRLCLTLKPNSRRDFGFQTHWDSRGARVTSIQPGSPAELCHLCINDKIIAVDGVTVTKLNFNQWKNKMSSALQTGSLTMDVRRYGNRDWSTSEASLYKQPGQNRKTVDLTSAVPLLIGRLDHHANTDPALMALSKFNGQTNNVNLRQNMDRAHTDIPRTATNKDSNVVIRKNQRRRAEFFRQRGGSESAISDLQVPSLSPSSCSWSWDREEERRRQEKWQEEQERLLQEKYQRDQERLEAEWRKAQQDASSDNKEELKTMSSDESHQRVHPHVNGVTSKRPDEQCRATDAVKENAPCGAKEMLQEKTSDDWAKSMSTPVLTSPQKLMTGAGDQRKRKSQTTVSKVEQERQQILDEMKKRTQLLTDNSWIRQRSGTFYKENVMPGVPIKRYESMDHLESWRHSPVTSMTFTYPRPQSAAAGYCGSTKISSSRHSTGSMPPTYRSRTEPGGRMCCVCEGVLDSGAAMVIEALSLSFHLACFQCMGCHRDLRGTEVGVKVRIQNGRPYCEPCYSQLQYATQL